MLAPLQAALAARESQPGITPGFQPPHVRDSEQQDEFELIFTP